MPNKFKADRDLLSSKLAKAIKFIPSKCVIPAWENFLFTINDNTMEIIASDGQLQGKVVCPVQSDTNFSLCVPAKLIYNIISNMDAVDVTISMKSDTKAEIRAGRSKSNITLDCFPRHYSILQCKDVIAEITMHQSMLARALTSVKDFVNEEHPNETRRHINIAEIDSKMIFSGIKEPIMARVSIRPISINQWTPINIHPDTAKRITGILEETGEVTVVHNGKMISFFTSKGSPDHFEVTATTSSAKFPPTEKLFGMLPEQCITVNTVALRGAIKRLSLLFLKEDVAIASVNNSVSFTELVVSAEENIAGRHGEEVIPITNPHGMVMDKKFNCQAAMSILKEVDTTDVNIHFIPGAVRSPEGNSFIIPKVEANEENIYCFLMQTVI